MTALPTSRALLREAISVFTSNAKTIFAITAVGAALNLFFAAGSDTATQAYQSLWFLIVFAALLWSVQRMDQNQAVTVKEAFYKGTAPFLKLFLVVLMLSLYLIPLLIGISLYGTVARPQFGAAAVEIGVVAGIWLLLSLLTAYWLLRAVYAPFLVFKQTPVAAIKGSWRRTKNHIKSLAVRLSLLLVVLFGVSALYFVAAVALQLPPETLNTGFELLLYLFLLPFYVIYTHSLYSYESA